MMFIPAAAELCKINTVISEMGQMQMPGDVIGFKKHRFFYSQDAKSFRKKINQSVRFQSVDLPKKQFYYVCKNTPMTKIESSSEAQWTELTS